MSLKTPRFHSRRAGVAAAVAIATCGAAAAPAFADNGPVGVPVQLTTAAGTRQFAVESVSGSTLSALNIGTSGSAPFRVRVSDNAFNPGTQNPFSVSAVMNNLYQYDSSTGTSSYNVKIPSSAAKITFPASPLSAVGISIPFDPTVLLSGLIPSCAQINNLLGSAAALPTGQTPLTGLLNTVTGTALSALDPLCLALDAAHSLSQALPLTAGTTPVVAITTTLQKTLSDVLASLPLTDLPVNLTSPTGGTFTSPDYSSGIGANDPAKTATAATPVSLLSGAENVTTALSNAIRSAYANIPLIGTVANPGLAQVDDVLAALRSQAGSALTPLVTLLSTEAATNLPAVTDVLNSLTATLGTINVGGILNLTGSYLSYPSINVTPPAGTPVGTYRGTMTVTYLQQ